MRTMNGSNARSLSRLARPTNVRIVALAALLAGLAGLTGCPSTAAVDGLLEAVTEQIEGLRLSQPADDQRGPGQSGVEADATDDAADVDETDDESADDADSDADDGSDDDGTVDRGQGVFNKFALWSNGTQLRGANISQRHFYAGLDDPDTFGPGPIIPPYTQADIDGLAAAGANYVNISHPGIFTEKAPFVVDEASLANLDALLAMIAKADMFAVICFRSGPGRGEFALFVGQSWYPAYLKNDTVWESAEAQDAWVAMWRFAAERYRDNPVVVGYDLMVEPNASHVFFNEFDPVRFYANYGGTLYDWNQLYPRITTGIREVDPMTPILVATASYSSYLWLSFVKPTTDTRTVYTVHYYEPFSFTHQNAQNISNTYPGRFDADDDGIADDVGRDYINTQFAAIRTFQFQNRVPVAVTEFGSKRWSPGAAYYIGDVTTLFEEMGVNHAVWLWESGFEGMSDIDDFNFRHGPDPASHADVAASDFQSVLFRNWQYNRIRPSTVAPAMRAN